MPGFYVSNMGEQRLRNEYDGKCVAESVRFDGYCVARNTLNRFMGDKTLSETPRYIVITEGVLLNKAEICHGRGMAESVIANYEAKGDLFFNDFRGPFSGALYDKAADKWVLYTNHCGDSPLFYYYGADGMFAFGSQVNYVLDRLKASGVGPSLDELAVCAMLTYGFMFDGRTYAQEVKRLLPGHYAVIDRGKLSVRRYWRPKTQFRAVPSDEDEIIRELDRLFRRAVKREFEKDLEYGYEHVCDLSGGLDSRMTTWVSHDMGYSPALNLTYCQSGYIDELVAEQIAEALGNDLLFKPLDSARFLFDAEKLVRMNFGLGLYSGITGGESLLRSLDWGNKGIEHTGQMGDVIPSSFLCKEQDDDAIIHAGLYSTRLASLLPDIDPDRWDGQEQYLLCVRGMLGALSTHFVRRNYTEVCSPFLDVDFFDFCMSIPIDMRAGHRLYKKWIIDCYPDAASFIWEKRGAPLSASPVQLLAKRAQRKAFRVAERIMPTGKFAACKSMNPMDYWYATNAAIRAWMDERMRIERPLMSPELESTLESFYASGTPFEKTQAVTVIHALRLYFE